MHSGDAAAMPPARNEATLSFCHASRSVRMMMAIFVSNCMRSPQSFRGAATGSARPGMTVSAFGVAGPGADHAFLAAELVAFARRLVQRTGNFRPHRVAMRTAGIDHVDRQCGA